MSGRVKFGEGNESGRVRVRNCEVTEVTVGEGKGYGTHAAFISK